VRFKSAEAILLIQKIRRQKHLSVRLKSADAFVKFVKFEDSQFTDRSGLAS
jgi:hypothetical protein